MEALSRRSAGTSLTDCLPPSVHASFDGEGGYASSQQHLRWARRQRLIDDALTTAVCPPPNRTICHVVDCWWLFAHLSIAILYVWYLSVPSVRFPLSRFECWLLCTVECTVSFFACIYIYLQLFQPWLHSFTAADSDDLLRVMKMLYYVTFTPYVQIVSCIVYAVTFFC